MPPPEPMQCCPADTYSGRTDADGNEVPDCSCGDDCLCLCRDCRCPSSGWDDDEWLGAGHVGWAVGYDGNWKRDIGYGVPATCDRPSCGAAIDRGLSYVCGSEPYGGDRGCGLYFCGRHLTGYRKSGDRLVRVCGRCDKNRAPYDPTPDVREWAEWKLSDESWAAWRDENPEAVRAMMAAISR